MPERVWPLELRVRSAAVSVAVKLQFESTVLENTVCDVFARDADDINENATAGNAAEITRLKFMLGNEAHTNYGSYSGDE